MICYCSWKQGRKKMMKPFHLVYYVSMGCPSIEYSLQKAELYLENGVKAIQFDLPSRNPYRENPPIRERMRRALEACPDYEKYLEALTAFRRQHLDFEMQMVSYEDVILTIGTLNYIRFCQQNGIRTCRIAGGPSFEIARKDMNAAGIDTLTFIDYDMKDEEIAFARETGRAVMLRNKRQGMSPRENMTEWDERIRFLRERGIQQPIYATAEMKCGSDIRQARKAGADGAFVGSCLMALWDDDEKLVDLIHDLMAGAREEGE